MAKEEIVDLGIAKIKLKEVEEPRKVIHAKCPFCEKITKGTSESQMYYNIAVHVKQKHWDLHEADIFLKQLEDQEKIKPKEISKEKS